ncbi:Surfeit locus 6 [Penicillium alfredii]|uniref:Surfeit locus 6 n=1 Tax=Penicillium alfredii TaxID=1506179 RepID=A0A9W9JX03_9EURO|nr:Surfeit locus 6 [Penicillium alfredii]KAJ5084466.1 Surfeit locus 6 [Penicillium alfredii]
MLLHSVLLFLSLVLGIASARAPPTVYLVRHGEKPEDPDDHGLNSEGLMRAQCLRDLFGAGSGYDIGYILAPKIKWNGDHQRPYMTALPLAQDLGLPIDAHCSRKDAECVADAIRAYDGPGNILIVWRKTNMGDIQKELGVIDPVECPKDRFDLIWTSPYPYDRITKIESELCPVLDTHPGLVVQSTGKSMDDIEERLRSHAQAFDGLLSLIPAKYYYGDDTSDQWQRKKQTKEQAREAKRAKLDPESGKTAKDVMDENARKRKRDDGTLETDSSDGEEQLGSENPREGLSRGYAKPKKQKSTEGAEKSDPAAAAKAADAEARKKQREDKKAQKKATQKEKKKAKETAKKEKTRQEEKPSDNATEKSEKSASKPNQGAPDAPEDLSDAEDAEDLEEGDVAAEEGFSLEFNPEQPEQPSSASSTPNSSGFDASNPQSGSSSISSIIPPSASNDAKTSESKPLKATPEELKQRLQKRLDELRAARHADGLNGKPARNRQELIEARRQKAEQRKTHKKELRQKAKEEEQRKNDEAMARRFSRVAPVVFADGQHTDASLTNVHDKYKSRGATDAAAQLKVAEAKQARLAEMDPTQRADLEEKDRWLNAKKRAHGERVRDDTSLLKKALKRKESAKKKSEREWKDRLDTVSRAKDQRQTKREENLRKRREEKGNKGGKGKKAAAGPKKKARPGFEGSFKAKVGGKKK